VCGSALCAHFAFYPQRDFLDNHTNLNTIYQNLANNIQSNNLNTSVCKDIQIKNMQPKSKINHNAFYRYRNKFQDKSIAIFGNGPTVNSYIPIPDTINIGCNRCIYYDKLIFDFYFYNDWKHITKKYKEDIMHYRPNIDKFFGTFPFDRGFGASEVIAKEGRALLYDMEGPGGRKYGYQKDIDKYYVGDIGQSIIFVLMQFALYLNPKEIYIIGCDIDNINSNDPTKKYFHHTDHLPNSRIHSDLKKWWKEMKNFIDTHYNHIKINIINPIGLKGYFNDVYQN
jgi:hypothetical protein